MQVNHRYVGGQTAESFDQLVADLRSGSLAETVPPHGTLVRVRRSVGLEADKETIVSERAAMAEAQAKRAAAAAGQGGRRRPGAGRPGGRRRHSHGRGTAPVDDVRSGADPSNA